MRSIEEIPNNPFLPGYPIYPSNFVGRTADVKTILRYLPRVIQQGIPEHFFITGKRGMGKTSFIQYVASIVEKDYDMIPIYINNEGSNTIDELIANLLEILFKEFDKTLWGQNIIDSFCNRFSGINFGGFGITFNDKPEVVRNVKDNFREFLIEICGDFDEGEKGIFFIIDDVNGLFETPDFANWYKGLFETLGFYNDYVPAIFCLVTYPAKFDQLCEQNPSCSRMFNLINIDKLDDNDIREFFINNFKNLHISFEKEQYLKDMVYYSWGMPLIMQQIGDSIFWNLEGDCIDETVVYDGIKNAALSLKNKPLKNTLKKIKSPHYKSILLKLGKNKLLKFNKSELKELLNETETSLLDDFLDKMLMLNILESVDDECGEYEFLNILYFAYFLITATFEDDVSSLLNF